MSGRGPRGFDSDYRRVVCRSPGGSRRRRSERSHGIAGRRASSAADGRALLWVMPAAERRD